MERILAKIEKTNAGGLFCRDENGKRYIVTLVKLADGCDINDFTVGETVEIVKDGTLVISASKTDGTVHLERVFTIEEKKRTKNMNLICKPLINGIMAYWEKIDEAASYTVYLYINNQVIATRINDRNEMYTAFSGLAAIDGVTKGLFSALSSTVAASGRHTVSIGGGGSYRPSGPTHSGMDYFVQVNAEDREGEIIAKSEKVKCTVKEF